MPAAIVVGAEAPEFTLPGTENGSVRFTRGGEYVFLNFWKST